MERLTYFENGHWRMDFNGCQYQANFLTGWPLMRTPA